MLVLFMNPATPGVWYDGVREERGGIEYVRGRGGGSPRPETRDAAKRAAGIGGVDAADLVFRSGRVARRVLLFEEARCEELSSAIGSSPAGPVVESTDV
jgi:hypothetical protein